MNSWKSCRRRPVMVVMLNFSSTQNFRFFSVPSNYGLILNISYCAYQASRWMHTFTGMMKMTTTRTGTVGAVGQAVCQTAVMAETQRLITAAEMMDHLLTAFIFQLTLPSFWSSLITVRVSMCMVLNRQRNSSVGTVKTIHRRVRQDGTTPSWRSMAAKMWKFITVIMNGHKEKS